MKTDLQNLTKPIQANSQFNGNAASRSVQEYSTASQASNQLQATPPNSLLEPTAKLDAQPRIPLGWVYLWNTDASPSLDRQDSIVVVTGSDAERLTAGWIVKAVVPLVRLDCIDRLSGKFAIVHNGSFTKRPNVNGREALALGDAVPDPDGNFFFEPYRGGGRMEQHPFVEPEMWERYISASRFGEVNAYFHTDRVAAYVNGLLNELGYPSLPSVIVKVNAHNAIAEIDGQVDGVTGKKSGRCYPMQGGHYRLATRKKLTVCEHFPVSTTGEIHLGPGWKLTKHGALAERIGEPYRCNASHNAGTIYHEYGHHLTRHTADFRANHYRNPQDQCNFKTDVDEAYCDYLAATMMNSPYIWAFHHQHNSRKTHRRSLTSLKTYKDYIHSDSGSPRDSHENGTILAATLWDLRGRMIADVVPQDAAHAIQDTDLMVVNSLILIGQIKDHPTAPTVRGTCRLRKGFGTVRQALLQADRQLFQGRYQHLIRECFRQRKIVSRNRHLLNQLWSAEEGQLVRATAMAPQLAKINTKCCHATVPCSEELLTGSQLEAKIQKHHLGPYSLIAVGDVMIGSRARKRTNEFGTDYIFYATRPLFRRSAIVLANQEGPIARRATKFPRNHSYKVSPKYTGVLRKAGFNVLTLANNHLLDCGRDGVRETLNSMEKHGIQAIGVGRNTNQAHQPVIIRAGNHVVGLLGYYWNRRTAARKRHPGSALDTPEALTTDISQLRQLVDRIVVTVHWGVPYNRQPSDRDREKARLMISLGADAVIGHHPHIIQQFDVIDGRPVFYSVGNFAFGTGNSHAESLVVGVDFRDDQTIIDLFPAYVRNRDPRINYQPKIMTGPIAERSLEHLRSLSNDGQLIQVNDGFGRVVLPFCDSNKC